MHPVLSPLLDTWSHLYLYRVVRQDAPLPINPLFAVSRPAPSYFSPTNFPEDPDFERKFDQGKKGIIDDLDFPSLKRPNQTPRPFLSLYGKTHQLMMPVSNCFSGIQMWLLILALISVYPATSHAQETALSGPEALMQEMTGEWLMTGTIAKQQVIHDVKVDWILNRQYIRIHEVSREKNADGEFAYEAWIHIVWDQENNKYAILWLDNTARTNFAAEGVGHAKPDGDRIPFEWHAADGSGIRNTFSYDRARDSWSWTIDNVDTSGRLSSFAKLTLTRSLKIQPGVRPGGGLSPRGPHIPRGPLQGVVC